ncbi:hypothetical protein QQF64_003089 [Cirrhinus molitorella]|uniref:Uncharacterized protein n=1 Tax=Cirrhinus molitorella TaxID=172907 RepID=A0ABR3MKS4_9TELE
MMNVCFSDIDVNMSSLQRSRHDTYNHLKGASPSQQQAVKANGSSSVFWLQSSSSSSLIPSWRKQIFLHCSHAVNQGFSRCVAEIKQFLSKDEMKTLPESADIM